MDILKVINNKQMVDDVIYFDCEAIFAWIETNTDLLAGIKF